MAPEAKRMTVKLAGSIVEGPNAKRQRTEFAAKATSAQLVRRKVLRGSDVLSLCCAKLPISFVVRISPWAWGFNLGLWNQSTA